MERHGIKNVMVTVERKYVHKIEKYLKNHYKSVSEDPSKFNIELVVFHEDEEPVVVLRLLAGRIHGDFILMDGNTLIEMPLDQLLDTHTLTQASLTILSKEFDMTKLGKGPKIADVEGTDIFGIS